MQSLSQRAREYTGPLAALAAVAGSVVLVWFNASSYLMFHLFVELAACATFVVAAAVAANTRHLTRDGFVVTLSASLAFVALLQLLHALAYKGMGLLGDGGADLPTQLWIAARGLYAVNILVATLFIGRDATMRWPTLANGVVTVAILLSLFVWPVFPSSYVEGHGLTTFKVVAEYVISALFVVGIVRVWLHRRDIHRNTMQSLEISLILSVVAEILFTLYAGVYDAINIAGHLMHFVSSVALYDAIIHTVLRDPLATLFQHVSSSEKRFRTVADFTHDWEIWQGPDGRLIYVSPGCERITGYTQEQFQRDPSLVAEIVHPLDRDQYAAHVDMLAKRHAQAALDLRIITRDGRVRWINHVCQPVFQDGQDMGIRVSNRDITERKHFEEQREELLHQLQASLAEVRTLSGLIPICASCKNVRTDEGYWQSVEEYVQAHTKAGFTHGICPDCAAKLYPDIAPQLLRELDQESDEAGPSDADSSPPPAQPRHKP